MDGQIFISYRRDDSSSAAGRIYDRLDSHFSSNHIFMDVDNLDLGVDFVEAIEKSVGSCDALIAVIGKHWLMSSDEEGRRRLDNPEDFVRIEIASALKRGVRVIPVLVDDASMPRSGDLPVGGPDFSGDGDKAASALLTSNRKLNGIWAVWDVPAEGVISAARSAGKDDLVIYNVRSRAKCRD